ncbi:MAG: TIGR03085 family protein [Nocardioides sp.]|nr:TIGR03085 family protein [Nocardioides sp.]
MGEGSLGAERSRRSVIVAGSFFDAIERDQLCDLLDELGPQAPTLIDIWTTYDLAAHLVLRERDPLAAPGLVVPGAWGRFAERRQLALKETAFAGLVARLRSGPPPGFFRIPWVRDLASLNEFFVHHEDVRRANGLGPRTMPPAEDAALFRNVVRGRWILARRLHGVGLDLMWTGTDKITTARRGQPTARLGGLPGELLLYLFGRRDAADVEITGPSEAVETLQRARFGM